MPSLTVWCAAQCFLLAEQASRLYWFERRMFWQIWPHVWPDSGTGTIVWLPALAAAVRSETDNSMLVPLTRVPLPKMLSAKALPWHAALVDAWEKRGQPERAWWNGHSARTLEFVSRDDDGKIKRLTGPRRGPRGDFPLSRADREGENPQRLANSVCRDFSPYRSRTGTALNPDHFSFHDLHSDPWSAFWAKVEETGDEREKNIARWAQIEEGCHQLELPVPPDWVIEELTGETGAESDFVKRLSLLEPWEMGSGLDRLPDTMGNVVRHWLKCARDSRPEIRQVLWTHLVTWDRAGLLHYCGTELLPHLVKAVKEDGDPNVLWALARWRPAPGSTPDPALLRELNAHWQAHSEDNDNWYNKIAGWQARLTLRRAGVARESLMAFQESYLTEVANESDPSILLVLASWSPGGDVPPGVQRNWRQGWASRLNGEARIQSIVKLALSRLALEAPAGQWHHLRWIEMENWRQEEVWQSVISRARFREVLVALEAGQVPDFCAATGNSRIIPTAPIR